MTHRQTLGRFGEERAAIHVADLGYEIIERNWRSRLGEIDLIARDQDQLVFIEVKTRNGSGYGHPFEAITGEKISRMRKLAANWCQAREVSALKVRLDAISVLISAGRVSIEHLKDVF
jgi:putative endonuclease